MASRPGESVGSEARLRDCLPLSGGKGDGGWRTPLIAAMTGPDQIKCISNIQDHHDTEVQVLVSTLTCHTWYMQFVRVCDVSCTIRRFETILHCHNVIDTGSGCYSHYCTQLLMMKTHHTSIF